MSRIKTFKLDNKDLIIIAEQGLLSAMKNCDVEKLDELLHDELLFNIPNGETITKAMDLETYSSGKMKISEIKASKQEISMIGDNAIVSVVIDMKGMYFEHSLDGKYRILRIWKLFDNQWKVIAGSGTEIRSSQN